MKTQKNKIPFAKQKNLNYNHTMYLPVITKLQFYAPNSTNVGKARKTQYRDRYAYMCGVGKKGSYLEYLDREDARTLDKPELKNDQEIGTYLDYMQGRKGSSGIYTENGNADKKTKKKIATELKALHKNGGVIWDLVISFSDEFNNEHNLCTNERVMPILQEVMKDLNKSDLFFGSGVKYAAALHTNTDNPHIHVMFWDKYHSLKRGKIPAQIIQEKIRHNYHVKVLQRSYNLNLTDSEKVKLKSLLIPQIHMLKTREQYNHFLKEIEQKRTIITNQFKEINYQYSKNLKLVKQDKTIAKALTLEKTIKDKLPTMYKADDLFKALKSNKFSYGSKEMDSVRAQINELSYLTLNQHPELKQEFIKYINILDIADGSLKGNKHLKDIWKAEYEASVTAKKTDPTKKLKIENAQLYQKRIIEIQTRMGNIVVNNLIKEKAKENREEYKRIGNNLVAGRFAKVAIKSLGATFGFFLSAMSSANSASLAIPFKAPTPTPLISEAETELNEELEFLLQQIKENSFAFRNDRNQILERIDSLRRQ